MASILCSIFVLATRRIPTTTFPNGGGMVVPPLSLLRWYMNSVTCLDGMCPMDHAVGPTLHGMARAALWVIQGVILVVLHCLRGSPVGNIEISYCGTEPHVMITIHINLPTRLCHTGVNVCPPVGSYGDILSGTLLAHACNHYPLDREPPNPLRRRLCL
jgi:hypothetical protein